MRGRTTEELHEAARLLGEIGEYLSRGLLSLPTDLANRRQVKPCIEAIAKWRGPAPTEEELSEMMGADAAIGSWLKYHEEGEEPGIEDAIEALFEDTSEPHHSHYVKGFIEQLLEFSHAPVNRATG